MKKDTVCALSTPPGRAALAVIRVTGPEAASKIRCFVRLPKTLTSHRAYVRLFREDGAPVDQAVLTYFAKGRSFTGEETFEISCHGGPFIYNRILRALIKKGVRAAERGEFSLRAFCNGKMDLTQAEGIQRLIESRSEAARKSAFLHTQGRFFEELQRTERKLLRLLSRVEAEIDFSLEGLSFLSASERDRLIEDLLKETEGLLKKFQPFTRLQRGPRVGLFGPANSGKSTLFNRLAGEEKAIVTEEEGTTRDIVETDIQDENFRFSLSDTAGLREGVLSEAEKHGQEKTRSLFWDCDIPVLIAAAPQVASLSAKTAGAFLEKTFAGLSFQDGNFQDDRAGGKSGGAGERGGGSRSSNEDPEQNTAAAFVDTIKSRQRKARDFFLQKGFVVVTKRDLCLKTGKESLADRLFGPVFYSKKERLDWLSERFFYFSNFWAESKEFAAFQKALFRRCNGGLDGAAATTSPGDGSGGDAGGGSGRPDRKAGETKADSASVGEVSRRTEEGEGDGFFISGLRQLEGLQKMQTAFLEARCLSQNSGELDLIASVLRQGLLSLFEITGKRIDDKILDRIFKQFCIGK